MALKKLCSGCGKIIDYNLKRCEECEKKYKVDKAEKNRIYDKNVRQLRDAKYTTFYHSKEWIKTVDIVKSECKGLDIYSYYILHKIEYGDICHHIRPLKIDGWDDRCNVNRIVYLTHSNHALVHGMLNDNYEGTVYMMIGLVDRWKREYEGILRDTGI
ncbi:HNH endonuclease [Clostridium autoethanogenum]|uniref:HNH endonuclease n=1 Tax=Clostridium autoethanogenum TaxID=84023 RepID=A0A3M0SKW6_9CLOT|nr:HNH endonuclease [Clostridium autoethanogenum]RMC95197.1 HNH endonuclease [Clostridium autoethanogenum]